MTTYIGLIGGGNISETHARAALALPGVEIAATYGINAGKVARLCAEHGGKPYSDLAQFLAHRPMDLVAIGSPSGLHAAQGIAAAQGGLHVLTEQPIDINTERADALIAAADKAGVKEEHRVIPGRWASPAEEYWEQFTEVAAPFRPLIEQLTPEKLSQAQSEIFVALDKFWTGKEINMPLEIVIGTATRP